MKGFILLSREILDWEWYKSPIVVRVYLHLLLKANYKTKKWEGMIIKRGQLVTSLEHLCAELKLSMSQIRSALRKLEKSSYILKRSTNKFTLITIVNYDETQNPENGVNKQSASNRQSNDRRMTTTKKYNNSKNVKKMSYLNR